MRYSFWGIGLVVFGLLLLLDNFNVLDFGDTISTFWPLILILWGFVVLRRRNTMPPATPQADNTTQRTQYDPYNSVVSDLIHESSVFGEVFLVINSQTFKGGSVSTTFGNSFIDLSKATFASGDHILRIHGVFGNTRIVLPKDPPVLITATGTAGKLEIMGQRRDGISPSLEVITPAYATASARMQIIVTKVFGDLIVT